MALRVTQTEPRLVLDAEPLSLLAEDDPRIVAIIEIARQHGFAPAISAVSVAQVRRTGRTGQRLRWLRSRLNVLPVTEEVADRAAGLLEDAGLDGHEFVVDALVVAGAAVSSGQAKVASSDGSHIPKLCAAASVGRPSPVEWVRV
jgi:predicted nucleic acid-binding protein